MILAYFQWKIRAFPALLAFTFIFMAAHMLTAPSARADRLVMFDARGCPNCILFKRKMARKYRRSTLGKRYGLTIVDVNSSRMRRYKKRVKPIIYTPTFVMMRNGREKARFVGYQNPRQFMSAVKRMGQFRPFN